MKVYINISPIQVMNLWQLSKLEGNILILIFVYKLIYNLILSPKIILFVYLLNYEMKRATCWIENPQVIRSLLYVGTLISRLFPRRTLFNSFGKIEIWCPFEEYLSSFFLCFVSFSTINKIKQFECLIFSGLCEVNISLFI